MSETLGFIGLGNMGIPIASNLLKAGYELRVYNRTAEKAAALVRQGAQQAKSSEATAQPGGIVLTIVADDRALEELCAKSPSFVERLGPGGIHISMSTISPATARSLAKQHKKYGVEYVASPVFGRPDAAAAAQLVIPVSGSEAAKKRIQPILAAIGKGTHDFGEDPGTASVVKLCGNFLIASAIEGLAESVTLARKNGVDAQKMIGMFTENFLSCLVYKNYGKQIAEEKFEPANFRLVLGLKDINLVLETAEASSTPMQLASLLHDRWLASVSKGRGELDWTGIAMDVAEAAGLAPSIKERVDTAAKG